MSDETPPPSPTEQKPLPKKSMNDLLKEINDSDLEPVDKLWLFVSLCDSEELIKEVNQQAEMQQMKMANPSMCHAFVYGILRIVEPFRFLEDEEPTKEKPNASYPH